MKCFKFVIGTIVGNFSNDSRRLAPRNLCSSLTTFATLRIVTALSIALERDVGKLLTPFIVMKAKEKFIPVTKLQLYDADTILEI
jgi:hypothetical protein